MTPRARSAKGEAACRIVAVESASRRRSAPGSLPIGDGTVRLHPSDARSNLPALALSCELFIDAGCLGA